VAEVVLAHATVTEPVVKDTAADRVQIS